MRSRCGHLRGGATTQSEQRNDDILWAAFGETGSEVQRRAVVAAFALIVVADGEVSPGALSGAEERLRLANDADSRVIVIAAARAAVVADGTDADREEVLMGHIARLVGSEPATT